MEVGDAACAVGEIITDAAMADATGLIGTLTEISTEEKDGTVERTIRFLPMFNNIRHCVTLYFILIFTLL